MSQRILITGASGGFGQLIVNTLLQNGHQVAASMRNVESKNKEIAAKLQEAGARIVEIDVTSNESVQSGVQSAIDQLGGIDVVVNNAGVGVMGMVEHFTPEDLQKLFDINVFGVQRVNRAVLPHMRERGSGLLLHISSLLGRMSLPFYGPYNASKWALEALSEGYKVELSGFGVDSVLVEPGGYPTTFMHALMRPSDNSRDAEYGEFMNAPMQMATSFGEALANNPAQDPQHVADAVLKVIDTPAGQRPTRTVVDNMGMGTHIEPYNNMLDQITSGVYNAFGMGGMLELKTK